ncbi:MAG TPA: zf-HC2 domain-containing protein [Myxococcales bacterium]
MTARVPELSCREIVELVTDYLEGRMPPAERARFDQHLVSCSGCRTYLEQIRQTIAAVGAAREEDLPPAAREDLLRLFRGWKAKP